MIRRRSRFGVAVLGLGLLLAAPGGARAQEVSAAVAERAFRPVPAAVETSVNTAETPSDIAGLLDLEQHIRNVVEKVLPATVGLIIGQGQGSGVIISSDGYILTAAHVSGDPGERVTVILPDGKRVAGISLGRNQQLDNGLVRVIDESALPLPFAPIGESADLPLGSWTVALGHPGGFRNDRPPVVRVGRILVNREDYLATDNTLVGGDSGGPLFDMDGRIIGIHSRIGGAIEANIHVPIDRFVGDWDVLASGQQVSRGGTLPRLGRHFRRSATDGLDFDLKEMSESGALITGVEPNGPGAQAGLKVGDRIVAINEHGIDNGQDIAIRRLGLDVGEPITYRVRRDGREFDVKITPARLESGGGDADSDARMGIVPDGGYRGVGVQVESVLEGGPAHQAGMLAGDVIMEIDKRFVRNWPELRNIFAGLDPGDEIVVVVKRDGEEHSLKMTLVSAGDLPTP